MNERASFTREYWHIADTTCCLNSVDGTLEVTLTNQQGLVALWPCRDYLEAVMLASEWRAHPPRRWPDEAALE